MKSSDNFFEIPIFVDSNLGTHLALTISPDINAGDLKRKLGQEHFSCFADYGEIMVHALMVERRSRLYHLPDAVPIKTAFFGYRGTWFLHMHASILQDMPVPKLSSKHAHYSHNQISQTKHAHYSISSDSKIIESSTGKEEHLSARHSLESKEACSMNLSKEISVTGIISIYFSDLDEVSSCNKQCNHISEQTCYNEIVGSTKRDSEYSVVLAKPKKTVESDMDTVCSTSNVVRRVRRASKRGYTKAKKGGRREFFSTPISEKVQIGKKLVQAARNMSISGSGRKLFKPMFVSRRGNLLTTERNIAFEIDDSDE